MSCEGKAISPEQWIEWIDGTARVEDRITLERHVAICTPCQEVRDRLLLSKEALRRAVISDANGAASASRIWDNLCFRIRRFAGADQSCHAAIDLRQLRSILVSMCGEAAAEGALHKATSRAGGKMDAQFASSLGSIVEVMCGTRAARLVEDAANNVRKDKVA